VRLLLISTALFIAVSAAQAHKFVYEDDGGIVTVDASWIMERHPGCCGDDDCFEVKEVNIEPRDGGLYLKEYREFVPQSEIKISEDGKYW